MAEQPCTIVPDLAALLLIAWVSSTLCRNILITLFEAFPILGSGSFLTQERRIKWL
jgi:hypothetical protein